MTTPTDSYTGQAYTGSGSPTDGEEVVLSFDDVDVRFKTEFGSVHAVKGVDLKVRPGEVVALVGESGSGKSVTSMTAMRLLPRNATIGGAVNVAGREVGRLGERAMRRLRGNEVAMVFQEPMTALNPVLTIGTQMVESMELHHVARGQAALDRAVELLEMVGIPEPERQLKKYPHELSGGQRQRVVIAMAISCDPKVIIADEPTTALDVTVQADILDLLRSLKDKLNTGILLITHNMGVVADMADRVAVMFKGEIVERGTVEEVLLRPQHEYTRMLLGSVPRMGQGRGQMGIHVKEEVDAEAPLAIELKNLVIEYQRLGKPPFRAVDDVSFTVRKGEIVGLVGESGSGKSTIGRCALGLIPAASGEFRLLGEDMTRLNKRQKKALRKRIGVIFQDPAASLNPRLPIGECIAEPLVVHGVGDRKSRQDKVYELLDAVHLPREVYNRYPHEVSGGQRQRICVARALTLDPELLVADEPTSALDVSVQARVLKIFAELQEQFGFACLFISHDLAVIDLLAHKVVVLQNGKVVEAGPREQIMENPQEDYTQRLLAAAPVPDPIEQERRRRERHELLLSQGEEIAELQIDSVEEFRESISDEADEA
ncbi:ABC transporter ATP-binding protein [Ornithinimicrobium humiphilum]|uniref:Peptide/nickel transport system ATP-binding protein n=1 Tax=Ornithinimicrobium humiphilum TaxID=125288 RepID=A0A543KPK1_9MICO|nr:ABC transporter ATP-binding protein [Ornithinimicrobium humiphilum]TQM97013.1 peptide/nickel transport system ATP-binding protein [Ornithinimicrobium humiphilum]